MTSDENIWTYGGAIALALLSGFTVMQGVTVYAPLPFYIILLAWIIPPLAILLTPFCYFMVVYLGTKSPRFSIYILILCLMFGALNTWSIYSAWDYGIRYQGESHTQIVAIENIVGFAFVLVLATYAHLKKIQTATLLANFSLFALLSWCAFPYLGELP
ncbi:hypothetical protein [Sphingorhabdus sp. YGSMI21]|uniref:hypothetical protein n=1 Tax=Sphingorhabdus sp. YGSMI21 TaxID=2077182 RepID=UPI000C1E0A1A|nr:hypothetical protein [Sphingorhabdus sp. YGSMI21]ATW02375.1 hypothetical protein CHN51_01670 [Sphingorhabdus sp. YGSMI21]